MTTSKTNLEAHSLRTQSPEFLAAVELERSGDWKNAPAAYEDAIDAIMRHSAGQPTMVLGEAQCLLGRAYRRLSRYSQCESSLTDALHTFEQAKLTDLPEYCFVLNELGMRCLEGFEFDRAREYLTRVSEYFSSRPNLSHPEVATNRLCFSELHLYSGQLARLLHDNQEAVKIRRDLLGETHEGYFEALAEYGMAQASFGNFGEAESTLRTTLAAGEKALGSEHPQLVPVILYLTSVLEERGTPRQVPQLLERADEICRRRIGYDVRWRMQIQMRQAAALARRWQKENALLHINNALTIGESIFPLDHPRPPSTSLRSFLAVSVI
ncbi:MAG TPA: tetratricopeptide repeat protein [Oculatellaceae cyanobacterium]